MIVLDPGLQGDDHMIDRGPDQGPQLPKKRIENDDAIMFLSDEQK